MDCEKAYSLIHDFLDGTMSVDEEKAFDRHVARCAKCARELRAYRALDSVLDDMELENVPGDFAEPVIRFLKSSGRIREPAAPLGRARAPIFGWVRGRSTVPAVAAALLIVVLSAVSVVTGRFQGAIGKGTVAATNVYIDVQHTAAGVEVLDGISREVESGVRTAKTVAGALYLLLAAAGQTYLVPAVIMLVMITICMGWYVRTILKRSAQNASYCI